MKRLALYGKGGIGKSTTAVNMAVVLAKSGLRVALIGCDPKQYTVRLLTGRYIPSILDSYEEISAGGKPIETCVIKASHDILCCEVGGPKPGVGCAGRGIILALELLQKSGCLSDRDVVIYDVLGDVVCGGFAAPIVRGFADEVYIVSSGENAALYAANNILRGMLAIGCQPRGLVFNCAGFPGEQEVVLDFSETVKLGISGEISRNSRIPMYELRGIPITEVEDEWEIYSAYKALCDAVMAGSGEVPVSMPYTQAEFYDWMRSLNDRKEGQ
ncbi:MAG: P-loop NTPase [Lawsonibacter sp.]